MMKSNVGCNREGSSSIRFLSLMKTNLAKMNLVVKKVRMAQGPWIGLAATALCTKLDSIVERDRKGRLLVRGRTILFRMRLSTTASHCLQFPSTLMNCRAVRMSC